MGLRNTTNTRRASRRAVHCAAPHLDITPNTWHARSAGSEEARLAKGLLAAGCCFVGGEKRRSREGRWLLVAVCALELGGGRRCAGCREKQATTMGRAGVRGGGAVAGRRPWRDASHGCALRREGVGDP
jgi:hypothetical protein